MPKVFLSSTCEDLKDSGYRAAAEVGAKRAGYEPIMQEYWVASGKPSLEECLKRVEGVDVVVVIVAYWYGWKPPGKDGKSITRLECEHARQLGKQVIPLLVDPKFAWTHKKEQDRLADDDDPTEVSDSLNQLKAFKAELNAGIREFFTTPEDLRGKVESALREYADTMRTPAPGEPTGYLKDLSERTATVSIKGLGATARKANSLPIEEIYVPLTTPAGHDKREDLEQSLHRHRLLVISGLPGSGKSMFLRQLAHRWALRRLTTGEPAQEPFPLLIRIGELVQHIRKSTQTPESGDWILHFLERRTANTDYALTHAGLKPIFDSGKAVFLLDGLDEAPDMTQRTLVARVLEEATRRYRKCLFVVTTRPQPYTGTAVLDQFQEIPIAPLDDDAIDQFLERWANAIFPSSPNEAASLQDDLRRALNARSEIRRMAENPLMLTALAVIHHNEARLPEQRDKLYDAILYWLSRAREQREDRVKADQCLELLQDLAVAMHRDGKGRQTEIEAGVAADTLSPKFPQRADALRFLREEEADSGIITSAGPALRFWHLTFQEHLVARAIAGWSESQQREILLETANFYKPEWRETVLLFGGVLRGQGARKVNDFFSSVLDRVRTNSPVPERAQAVAALGSMTRDLRSYDFTPEDPRYRELVLSVLPVFDLEWSQKIDFQTRLDAAEALGLVGDPRIGHDKPENWINIEGQFEIGRFPVTVAEYGEFLASTGHPCPPDWKEQLHHPNRPVTTISWHDAAACCDWAGTRLPTDKEWELAAGGSEKREYPWGDPAPDATRANYDYNVGSPTPVGLYPAGATPAGVCDMAGNVWEWSADWYDRELTAKSLRGGSWVNGSGSLRVAGRYRFRPENRDGGIGFRWVRE